MLKRVPSFPLLALILILATALVGCGDGEGFGSEEPASFQREGFAIRVESLSTEKFRVTIVENKKYLRAVYSVYGVDDETNIEPLDTVAHVRLAHVINRSEPAQFVEVTLKPEDRWIVLFLDDYDGFGWIFSDRTELARIRVR